MMHSCTDTTALHGLLPKGLHLEEEQEMENVEDVIPVSSDEGFESD